MKNSIKFKPIFLLPKFQKFRSRLEQLDTARQDAEKEMNNMMDEYGKMLENAQTQADAFNAEAANLTQDIDAKLKKNLANKIFAPFTPPPKYKRR